MKTKILLTVCVLMLGALSLHAQDLVEFQSGNRWGYRDKNNKIVIPARYDYAFKMSNGLARVKLGDKWGIIDENGKTVIPFEYQEINDFGYGPAGVAIAKRDGKYGLINKAAQTVVPFEYEKINQFWGGRRDRRNARQAIRHHR